MYQFKKMSFMLNLCEIAEQAGVLIGKNSNKFDISTKQDGSIFTSVDLLVEKLLIEKLTQLTPHIPIVGEEGVASGLVPKINNNFFWLIDPIDGTNEFVNKTGNFAINIGLIKDNKAFLGVVHSPLTNKTYFGKADSGSWVKNIKSGEINRLRTNKITENQALVVLLYHTLPPNDERDKYLKSLKIKKILRNSDSLRFCRVAEGEVDINPFFEVCYEWDTAAGHAILKGAGGNIYTLNNNELDYGKKDFINPSFIAKCAIAS